MQVRFADPKLDKLETDPAETGGYAADAVRGFRKVMQVIRAATDERDLYAMKSLHFEKLCGDRLGQHSLRLNRQWRLIVTIEKAEPKNTVVVIEIVDYH
jgi:toxin HigB-1